MWLREENLHDCVQPFSFKKINGIQFMNLSDHDIKALRISQDSKRKLAKVLKKIRGKRQNVRKRFDGDSSGLKERRKPPAAPAHVHDDEADSDDGWATDDFDDDPDEFEEEESDDESGGEYIEAEDNESLIPTPGSPAKEVPNVPLGLVAQLKAGLNGTMGRAHCIVPPESLHTKTTPMPYEDDDQIYDEPPEEVYEEPSDDSGSGIVVRPTCPKKLIRCDSSEGYIDARSTSVIQEEPVQCPPPAPARPPKPGFLKAKKPPPVIQPEPEIYDEVPEDDQLGRTQVVEQETYEVPDDMDGGQQSSQPPPQYDGDAETYEVPEQEDQETYEVPDDHESAPSQPSQPSQPPPRPSFGGFGLKPTRMNTLAEKMKPFSPKDLPKQKPGIKPPLASKPQVNQKPNAPGPVRSSPNRSSRLYPASKDNIGPPDSPTKRLSGVTSLGSRPPMATPSQEPEKNNNELSPTKSFSRLPPPPNGRKLVPPPVEESPPPPPRPGAKPPSKLPSRLSDLDPQRKSQAFPPLPDARPADSLKQYPWFLGSLDKKVAENALNSFSKEGAFIVRNSSKDPNSYSMSLYFNKSVRHLRVPRLQNKKYVLGDSGKVQFDTIVELVDYYSQHHVDLKSGGSTSLTAACPVK